MLSSRALLLTRRVKACFCRWVDHFQNIAFSCTAIYIPLSHKAMLSTSKCASFPQYSCRGTRIFLAIMWLHHKTLVVGWKARSNFSFHEPMLYQFPFKVNRVDLCSLAIDAGCCHSRISYIVSVGPAPQFTRLNHETNWTFTVSLFTLKSVRVIELSWPFLMVYVITGFIYHSKPIALSSAIRSSELPFLKFL